MAVLVLPALASLWRASAAVPRPARLNEVAILNHLQPNRIAGKQAEHSTLQQMFLP